MRNPVQHEPHSVTLVHPVQHEPHSASASLRLRSGYRVSHGGHGGSAAAPPTPPSKSAFPTSRVRLRVAG